MCRATTCRICGKRTWTGCGQHVDEALRGVPADDRCQGHAEQEAPQASGFIARVLGR